jgi:peptidoglycan/LPS O-acetylase OafA/YrhL
MKRARNLIRLQPVALFILLSVLLWLFFTPPSRPAWLDSLFQAMFLVSLALVAESGGAMLISARSKTGFSLRGSGDELLTLLQ